MESHWLPNIQTILTIEAVHEKVTKDPTTMEEGLKVMDALISEMPGSPYVAYAKTLIEHGVYHPRCESRLRSANKQRR
jgi:hypothetical protein